MKSIELSEIAALGPFVQPGSQAPVVVTQNGQTIAAIVPADDNDVESLLLSVNPQFQAILERSQHRLETEGGTRSSDVRTRLGLPPADSPT